MQYLKFTYSFLQCEKMLPAPAVSGINAALGSCSVHCAAAPAPSRELCPDKSSCWGTFAHSVSWGCWSTMNIWRTAPVPLQPQGPLKSHLSWNVLQDSEIRLVPKSGRRVCLVFGIPSFLTYRAGNRLTCSPRTGQQRAETVGLSCHPAHTAAKLWCALGQGHFCFACVWHRRETKSNADSKSPTTPLFLHSSQDS